MHLAYLVPTSIQRPHIASGQARTPIVAPGLVLRILPNGAPRIVGAGAEPHDAIIDAQGMIWYDDFGQSVLGRLDPKTGETKEWPLPVIKEGVPPGSLCLAVDKAGNIWIARPFQAGIRPNQVSERRQFWMDVRRMIKMVQKAVLNPGGSL